MVVQHNMQAINANRQLNVVTGQQAKSTEKLSSGYKINRAADDAAGLSISEKMRRQIRGLDRASTNASDGISAVQTAEGALNEVHDMLQRMNELANQASNGTNSQTDREAIQNEIDQLTTEIDRVSETTKFNETMLLKGSGDKKNVLMNAHDAGLKGSLVDNKDGTADFSAELKVGEKVSIGGKTYTLKEDDGKVATNIKDVTKDISSLDVGDKVVVKNGSSYKGYQVTTRDLSTVKLTGTAASVGSFSQGSGVSGTKNGATVNLITEEQSIATSGNRVAITYIDDNGKEQVFEMQFVGSDTSAGSWQKINNYNEKTGDANLAGINLYDNKGNVTNTELNNVLKTATKIVATQYNTGETITYGTADTIKKAVEEDTRVNSEVYITDKPGTGAASSFGKIYGMLEKSSTANLSVAVSGGKEITSSLGEAKLVKETNEAVVGDDGSITIHDAKKLMAQELKAANNIGVDDTSSVTATFKKSGSDIAQELAIGHGDTVTVKKADKNGNDVRTFYTVVGDIKEAASNSKTGLLNNVFGSKGNVGYAYASTMNASITQGAVSTKDSGKPTSNSRITITSSDGTVTELKFVQKSGAAAGSGSWQRVDNGNKVTLEDMDELLKDATKLDYKQNVTKPESTTNVTVHWRTAEGMRDDISQLDAGDKVKVHGGTKDKGTLYDTGDVAVEEGPASSSTQKFDLTIGTAEVSKALNFNLHVGADADLTNKIGVNVEEMNSKYLGIKGLDVVGKDKDGNNIDDGGKAATYAIDAIEDAIQKVNDQRSALGSVQNRLEHTITNLDNVVENTTSAESRIRDTDIADEMVRYSKNNILAQAGQSMLAQANQSTQGALSLLG